MKFIALFQIQLKDMIKNLQTCLLFFVFPAIGFIMSSSMKDQSSFFIVVFATMHVVFTPMMIMVTVLAEQKEQKIIRNLAYAGIPTSQYLAVHSCLIFLLTLLFTSTFLVFPGFSLDPLSFITASMIGIIISLLFGGCIALSTSSMTSANALVMPIAMLFSFIPMLTEFNEGLNKIALILYSKQIGILMTDIHQADMITLIVLVSASMILLYWFYHSYQKSIKEDV
ncbi:MAG: hypothetical protein ACLRVU_07305 [Beduini sp.]|uniref:hypothetical protein n=1 Tax=Beduini sp. TaxID=1922300 RepID=UPI0039A3689A